MYGYSYDYQNRLLDAWYRIPGSAVNDSYNEHLTYDKNGNILSLLRNGMEESASLVRIIDELEYEYDDGNKLLNVTDYEGDPQGFEDGNISSNSASTPNDFEYDDYGNLIIDRNKGITQITYNHLSLPKKVTFGTTGTIEYLYDANGVKLRKKVSEASNIVTTDYLDGFQYKDDQLEFFPHAEGYVKATYITPRPPSTNVIIHYSYVYNYTNHLGNIRLRYTADPLTYDLAILEEDHYYPFGLKHKGYNNSNYVFNVKGTGVIELVPGTQYLQDTYQYKFNGMEWQDEMGLNYYDFGARNYDPALGRWMNIDPLAELMRRHSPYNFAFNNPIFFIDPDGMMPRPAGAEDIDIPTGILIGETSGAYNQFWSQQMAANGISPQGIYNAILDVLPKEIRNQVEKSVEALRSSVENFDFSKLAIGVESTIGIESTVGLKGEANAISGNVIFLGGEDAGYVYTYYGGELGAGAESSINTAVVLGKTSFVAYNHSGEGGKLGFAGEYQYFKGGAAFRTGTLTAGVDVSLGLNGSYAKGSDWDMYSVGGTLGVGAGVSTVTTGSIMGGIGNIQYAKNQQVGQPKSSRATSLSYLKLLTPFR